jgi:CubicO group peptidase (beta-lactamase class C family)
MRGMRLAAAVCLFLGLVTPCEARRTRPARHPRPAAGQAAAPTGPIATPVTSPQAQTADVKTPATPQGHALDAADVEAFFDGIVPLQLERSDIAGASVLVMRGDTVLLQKGYGFADEKKREPVDPAKTIFRLASISKLFTWTSVMQLVEQGKLDLDQDVNNYLDFKIRPAFGKPITLRNLMTHTGGFEESERDVIVIDAKHEPTLRDFLIHNQPERLFPPGKVPAYSNYGVGLAGYIVQRVSGEPYEQYVADHIFNPLKMTGSTFYQPPQPGVTATPSEGYRGDTEKPPVGFEIFNPAPAGGLSSTAPDMGRFARALLNGGTLDGAQILKPETLALMWTPQFRASPQMPPICMGFYQDWRDQVKWIGHEGDLIAFHSLFFMDPASKTVLFISYNSAGGGAKPRPELIDMFTDRYFAPAPAPEFLKLPIAQLKPIEGTYETTRRADSTRARLAALFGQSTASVDKDGVLHLSGRTDLRGHPMKFRPLGNDLWQEVDGQSLLFAIRDPDGTIVRLAGDFPGVQSERVAWYQTAAFVLTAVLSSLLVLVLVLAAPLLRVLRRIFLRRRTPAEPQLGTMWLPIITKVAALAWVAPLVVAVWVAIAGADTFMPPTSTWDKWFILMNLSIGLALILSLFPVVSARNVWTLPHVRWITKTKFTLVALSCLVLAWFSLYFHLIGTLRV